MSVFDPHKPRTGRQQPVLETAEQPVIENSTSHEPAAIYAAMQQAYAASDDAAVLSHADGFSKRAPQDALTPAVYALAARAMHRGFADTEGALALLAELDAQYPDNAEVAAARIEISGEHA